MPLRGAVPAVLVLAACAHSSARTDGARPQADAPSASVATPTPAAAAAVGRPAAAPPVSSRSTVDFAREIQPILESRCQPCHFPGGKMYERRPFDRAATIRELGTKLFTRIKDEHEQDLIRRFLAQPE
jgi:hypothetical protein